MPESSHLPQPVEASASRAALIFRAALGFIFELALIALGWGVDDLRGYLASPVRVAVLGVVALHLLYNIYRAVSAPRFTQYRLEHIGVYRLQLMAVESVYLFGPFTDRRAVGVLAESARWWGLALFVLGTLGVVWSNMRRPALFHPAILAADSHGAGWSCRLGGPGAPVPDLPPGPYRLSDFARGPYRWLRYPHFIGQCIMLVGLALCFRSWTGLAFTGMLFAADLQRVREVDRAYERFYGNAWAAYAEKSWRLIPLIY